MHTGALVMNIPWDCRLAHSPDHDLFWEIAEGYSYLNPPMWNSPYFYHGVTHGGEWYVIHGGMQDWSYHWRNELHITMELSDTFWPSMGQMDAYWDDNREAMLHMMEEVLYGVRGLVTDAYTGDPLEATIEVLEVGKDIKNDPDLGDYYRLLLPGTYTLRFSADGYEPLTVNDVVVEDEEATILDVQLYPEGSDVADLDSPAERARLFPPRPNPLSPGRGSVRLLLDLPVSSPYEAAVHDASGRMIREMAGRGSSSDGTGRRWIVWDGTTSRGDAAPAGIYWVRVRVGDEVLCRPVSVIR
jgi:hypothetical protein